MFKSSQNHPLPCQWKNSLPWNQSLVLERLQITGLKSSWSGEISSPEWRDSHLPSGPWATASSGFLDNAPKGMVNICIPRAPFPVSIADKKIFLISRGFFPSARSMAYALCAWGLLVCIRWLCFRGAVFLYVPITSQLHLTDQAYFMFAGVGGFGGAQYWLHLWPTCYPPQFSVSGLSLNLQTCTQPGCASWSQKWTDVNVSGGRPQSRGAVSWEMTISALCSWQGQFWGAFCIVAQSPVEVIPLFKRFLSVQVSLFPLPHPVFLVLFPK